MLHELDSILDRTNKEINEAVHSSYCYGENIMIKYIIR